MKRLELVATIVVAMTTATCVKGSAGVAESSTRSAAKAADVAKSSPPTDRGAASATLAPARDICSLLSSQDVAEITGLSIERVERKPNGCDWYANAAAQQHQGAETARGSLEKLNKGEPKSADEELRTMESLLKGVSGAVSSGGPLFGVSVQWENADQAEATLKGTVTAIGGGLPGGRLEPLEGLGDRAYMGPAGSFFYVRKGPALLTFGWSAGTRDQAIALARLIVSRI